MDSCCSFGDFARERPFDGRVGVVDLVFLSFVRDGNSPQKNPAQIQNLVSLQAQKFIFSVSVFVLTGRGRFQHMVVVVCISTIHRGRQSVCRVAKHFTPVLIVSKLIEAGACR
jgi:hypothetical protein